MNVFDLMNLIQYTITCIGAGIAVWEYLRHKK